MRTNVTFRHPAPFVPLSEEDGILSVLGADWFVLLLKRIPGLAIEDKLCQEDYGVVAFVERNGKKFWIGLSAWEGGAWIAHVHHGSWLQRFRALGKQELQRIVSDLHDVLAGDPLVSDIAWYQEDDVPW